jgi:hypothetical protein
MGKEEELKLIADMLTIWQIRIHNRKALDFFDINRTAEDIAMMILNEIYGLNLENLNRDYPNMSAIDLNSELVTGKIFRGKIFIGIAVGKE